MITDPDLKHDLHQRRVTAHFDSHALDWKTIYERPGVYESIHQQRRTRALGLIDGLAMPAGSRVLEIGCGAGTVTVSLALRGHFVDATDIAPGMVDFTRSLAVEAKVEDRVRTTVGDVRSLALPDCSFDLVVALGVLPWIQPPLERPVREMARVLKPGGYLVANIDNRWRLNHILDPFVGGRHLLRSVIEHLGVARRGLSGFARTCSSRHFDSLLSAAGLSKQTGFTLGFGPFSLLTREVVPESLGVKAHSKLQRLADDGVPFLRTCGSQYVVLAKKRLS
jgi:SAM-dependent methyltransferase